MAPPTAGAAERHSPLESGNDEESMMRPSRGFIDWEPTMRLAVVVRFGRVVPDLVSDHALHDLGGVSYSASGDPCDFHMHHELYPRHLRSSQLGFRLAWLAMVRDD